MDVFKSQAERYDRKLKYDGDEIKITGRNKLEIARLPDWSMK